MFDLDKIANLHTITLETCLIVFNCGYGSRFIINDGEVKGLEEGED